MSFLLRELPFDDQTKPLLRPDGSTFCDEAGQPLIVFHDQIVFWASLTPVGALPPIGTATILPVVLDTGFNDTFLIREEQLRLWAGLALTRLQPTASGLRISSALTIARYEADLWLYHNQPGSRNPTSEPPVRLELPDGIAVWPGQVPGSRRLPLFGLRALCWLGLRLLVDGAARMVALENNDP